MNPAQVAHIMALVDEYLYAPLKPKRAAIETAMRDAPQAEGWVMVPVEPTDEMLEAARTCHKGRMYPQDDKHGPAAMRRREYAAMLAARPSAPTAVEPDERAEFEFYIKGMAAGNDNSVVWKNPDGTYVYTQSEWLAFQAGRASKGTK